VSSEACVEACHTSNTSMHLLNHQQREMCFSPSVSRLSFFLNHSTSQIRL